MTPDPITPPMLAGYRLVRRLGVGSRAKVFLGVAVADRGEPARTAVLKVFRHDLDPADAGRELDALTRISLPHCVSMRDVASGPGDLPIPILSRVKSGSVAQLLAERDSIEPGEAVTILAPLPSTLTALHGAGVVHSALTASSIHLGAAGEPVLIGFGHASLFDRGLSIAALDEVPAVIAERDRLARVASAILDRVRPGSAASRLRELQGWLESSAGSRRHEFAEELEERLFELAPSIPIHLAVVPAAAVTVPGRIGERPTVDRLPKVRAPDGRRPEHKVSIAGSARHRATAPRGRRSAKTTVASRLEVAIAANPVDAAKASLLLFVRGVRKPFWFAVGGIAVALVLALALVPQERAASVAAREPLAAPTSAAAPAPSATAGREDPASALTELLDERVRCMHELSVVCLDSVDESGSSAQRDDVAIILAIRSGAEVPAAASLAARGPRLVQRLGDSALVALGPHSDPASVLMIRSKAGWRLRSYLSGQPVRR